MKKFRDLVIIILIYVVAFGVGYATCFMVENTILKMLLFDVAATLVTFIFSLIFHNSSVYDAYWSLRLTINWIIVTTGFSYEDWRYKKYREEHGPFVWFILNFIGIHFMPTLIVFVGMLPMFEIIKHKMNALSLIGMVVILLGTLFEYFADRQMHKFLDLSKDAIVKCTCRTGLWNYSRHPNYLGEIMVWWGVFIVMLPYALNSWYFVVGAVAVTLLFNVVSIPLMEKRQLKRRSDYAEYRKSTSRLLILPHKKVRTN